MTYVFDNSPLSVLFKSYYPARFPSLWARFDQLVDGGSIVSTREVLREIEIGPIPPMRDWADGRRDIFSVPTAEEGAFVARIYAIPHFQQNIEAQKLLRGGRNADPFVIAKAAIEDRCVVTMERIKPNAVKIPNICERFGVRCLTLEEFMEEEGWVF